MKLSIIKEYFLYRLQYKKEQLALNEFHEFCDHVKEYSLQYMDILIYRKAYVIARNEKCLLSEQYRKFYDSLKGGDIKCGAQ